jgi:CubicO group peptidase (beta-lactamase class C family)
MAPAVPPVRGFRDACLKADVRFSLGFEKPGPKSAFGYPGSFGAPGTGGSFAFADPDAGTGFAYIMNRMGASPADPRVEAPVQRARTSAGEQAVHKADAQ